MARALEGIRVIDLTVWFQGPVSAQFLADFGADVIKVERPQGGDQARGVRSIKSLEIGDWNQYFLVINRNKKSLVIDLRKPCLLYTSDAADERSSVDLGGRRIIKKKHLC